MVVGLASSDQARAPVQGGQAIYIKKRGLGCGEGASSNPAARHSRALQYVSV